MIGVTIAGSEIAVRRLRRGFAVVPTRMAEAVRAATLLIEKDLKGTALSGAQRRGSFWGVMGSDPGSGRLGVRTGAARRSIQSAVFVHGGTVVGTVGSPLPYVRFLEAGGLVSGSPYLRIPTANAQTAAGQDRLMGASARTLPGGFVFRSAAGNLWVARRASSGIEFWYLLKRSVRIRGRHAFRRTTDRSAVPVRRLLEGAVVRVVRETRQ